jgi:hypothetical protein
LGAAASTGDARFRIVGAVGPSVVIAGAVRGASWRGSRVARWPDMTLEAAPPERHRAER